MEIVNREAARARGLLRYFTGFPCKRGHVAERWTSVASCVVCQRESGREWKRTHPEVVARANAAFRAAHPDYARQWSADNAEHVRQKSHDWYWSNRAWHYARQRGS